MLILAGNALGFFTGSEIVILFSIDLSDLSNSFREESNTTIKIYIGHEVLLVNEVHNIIKRNSLFDIRTTIRYKVIFRTQNRMNCKLCRIKRREYGFIVFVDRFLRRDKFFNFDKGWALKSDRRQVLLRNFTGGTLVAGRSELLPLRKIFKEWYFRVASCCFFTILTDWYLFYMYNFSFVGQSYNGFHIWDVFLFLGTWCKF